jgi:hypothetical protein
LCCVGFLFFYNIMYKQLLPIYKRLYKTLVGFRPGPARGRSAAPGGRGGGAGAGEGGAGGAADEPGAGGAG